ncbi:PAS domain S-box protein [Candidatus Uhrbacteria bacterium]|nr:PAS domain S-box protein [Candidatus Uhrbacteria bacterium]
MPYRQALSSQELNILIEKNKEIGNCFDAIDEHIVLTDANANIIYANKAVEKRTGYPITEIIGKNPGDLWGGNMPNKFYEKMWHRIKEEKISFVGEVKNRRKDGTEYWQELRIYPILDTSGEVMNLSQLNRM